MSIISDCFAISEWTNFTEVIFKIVPAHQDPNEVRDTSIGGVRMFDTLGNECYIQIKGKLISMKGRCNVHQTYKRFKISILCTAFSKMWELNWIKCLSPMLTIYNLMSNVICQCEKKETQTVKTTVNFTNTSAITQTHR